MHSWARSAERETSSGTENESSAGGPPQLWALAGMAGNQAMAGQLARPVHVQRSPQGVAVAEPGSVTSGSRPLQLAVRAALVQTSESGDGAAFATAMTTAVDAAAHGQDPAVVADLHTRITAVAAVAAEHDGQRYTYLTATRMLRRLLGQPPDVQAATRVSYGVDLFVAMLSEEAGYYLGAALPSADPFWQALTPGLLATNFGVLLDQVGHPDQALDLELEGTLTALIRARADFAGAQDQTARAAAGHQVGEISRRVLLLDDTLRRMRENGQTDATGPLEQRLLAVSGQIDTARQRAATEQDTRQALGDDMNLLRPQQIRADWAFTDWTRPMAAVTPEEAMPRMTDAASLRMLGELTDRVRDQAAEVDRLRAQVVPTAPSYSMAEFVAVYRRWFAFFSPAARDNDPAYQQIRQLYDGLYDAMGHAGTEGGFGRTMLMAGMLPYVPVGSASAQFGREINAAAPRRDSSLSGTASDPRFQYAETFGAAGPVPPGPGAEATSRDRLVDQRGQQTAAAFRRMEQAGPPQSSGITFHNDRAQQGWNYLVVSHNELTGTETREQSVMPPEVASYMLARQQQLATFEGGPHRPGVGEAAVRSNGVEAATASATARYERGAADDTVDPAAAQARADLDRARQQAGARGPTARSATDRVVSELITHLETYLSAYFQSQQDPAARVAAIAHIADEEYQGGAAFQAALTPAAIGQALAIAIGIAGFQSVLTRLGPIGQAVSQAVGQVLRHAGVTPPATAINLVGFIHQAGGASSFHTARSFAFFAKNLLADLGQLVQDAMTNAAVQGFRSGHAIHTEVRTAREAADRIRTVLPDAGHQEVIAERLDAEIARLRAQGAGTDHTDPDLERFAALRDHLRHRSSADADPDIPLVGVPAQAAAPGAEPGAVRFGGDRTSPHDQWIGEMLRLGVKPRTGPPEGPPLHPGSAGRFTDARQAYQAYEGLLRRPGEAEIGVYHHARSGEYAVQVGTRTEVAAPGPGWEPVVHYHANPGNTLTQRMPAPADVHGAAQAARARNAPVTEFVEYPIPGVGRGVTQYTATPDGRVTIEYTRPTGERVRQEFPDVAAYQREHGARSTYAEPGSAEYDAMLADLDAMYSGQQRPGGIRTASGVVPPEWHSQLDTAGSPAVTQSLLAGFAAHPAHLEGMVGELGAAEVVRLHGLFGGSDLATLRAAAGSGAAVRDLATGLTPAEVRALATAHPTQLAWAVRDHTGVQARDLLALPAPTVARLNTVPAVRAHSLLHTLTTDPRCPITHAQFADVVTAVEPANLDALAVQLGGGFPDVVHSAVHTKKGLPNLNAMAARTGTSPLTGGPFLPVGAGAAILDSNLLTALQLLRAGVPWRAPNGAVPPGPLPDFPNTLGLDDGHRRSITRLAEEAGVAPLADPPTTEQIRQIVDNLDIRLPATVIGEQHTVSPGLPGAGLPVNRDSPHYRAFIDQMATRSGPFHEVGEDVGGSDRSAVADALFADRAAPGDQPSFFTNDYQVFMNLRRWAVPPMAHEQKYAGKNGARRFAADNANGFVIQFPGHPNRLLVRPVALPPTP